MKIYSINLFLQKIIYFIILRETVTFFDLNFSTRVKFWFCLVKDKKKEIEFTNISEILCALFPKKDFVVLDILAGLISLREKQLKKTNNNVRFP
jgi:hypothetical protein